MVANNSNNSNGNDHGKTGMMRKLKHHEKKLLKHTDLYKWKVSNNVHENKTLAMFCIDKRQDYVAYAENARLVR